MDIPPMGVEMGQLAKKRGGGKRNGWIASSLATNETSQKFQIVEYMISLSGTGTCGEEYFRCRG